MTLLTREAAREARQSAGLPYEEGVDGLSTYVENTDPALREVPVDDVATVVGSQQLLGDGAQGGPAELELADLMLHLDEAERPLLVEVAYDGLRVGTVTEVYLP